MNTNTHNEETELDYDALRCADIFENDDELYEEIHSDIAFGTIEAFADMSAMNVRQLNKHSAMGLYTEWTAKKIDVCGSIIRITGRGTTRTKKYGDLRFAYTAEINTTGRRYYVNCDMDDVALQLVLLKK